MVSHLKGVKKKQKWPMKCVNNYISITKKIVSILYVFSVKLDISK